MTKNVETNKKNGFISLHRSILNTKALKSNEPVTVREAFIIVILLASYRSRRWDHLGAKINLERGQLCVSIKSLMKRFKFKSRGKVRRLLSKWRDLGMIRTDYYRLNKTKNQYEKMDTKTSTQADTQPDTDTDTQADTNNNYHTTINKQKTVGIENGYPKCFESLWKDWKPMKNESKKRTCSAWKNAQPEISAEILSTCCLNYSNWCVSQKRTRKHLSTFLNSDTVLNYSGSVKTEEICSEDEINEVLEKMGASR